MPYQSGAVYACCFTCGGLTTAKGVLMNGWYRCPLHEGLWFCAHCWEHHWANCLAAHTMDDYRKRIAGEQAEIAAREAIEQAQESSIFECYICKDEDVGASCQDCLGLCCFDHLMGSAAGIVCVRCRQEVE